MAKFALKSEKYKISTLVSLFLLLIFYVAQNIGFSFNIGFLNFYILILLFFATVLFAYLWHKSKYLQNQQTTLQPANLTNTYWNRLKIRTILALPGLIIVGSLVAMERSGESGTEYTGLAIFPLWILSLITAPLAIYYSILIILKSKIKFQKIIAFTIITSILLIATYIFAPDFYKNALSLRQHSNYQYTSHNNFTGYILGIAGALSILIFTIFGPRLGLIKKKSMFQTVILLLVILIFFYLYFKLNNRQPEYYNY